MSGSHLFGTCPDPTFFGTHPNFTFPVLAWIPPFRYSPGSHLFGTRLDPTFFRYSPEFYLPSTRPDPTLPVLVWISLFRYSPGFYLPGTHQYSTFSGTRLDFYFLALTRILPFPCTHSNPSSVLARIPHYRYSHGFPFSSSYPDFTFSILTRILPFLVLAWISIFRYSPGFYYFRYSPGFYYFPVLTRTLLRYSPGFYLFRYYPGFLFSNTRPDSIISRYSPGPFFGTPLDSTFLALARILPFPVLTQIQTFPVLARTFLRSLLGFPYLLRHRPRISLSFPALCPNHSSSQASCLVFFKSFNRSDSVPLAFSSKGTKLLVILVLH